MHAAVPLQVSNFEGTDMIRTEGISLPKNCSPNWMTYFECLLALNFRKGEIHFFDWCIIL